MSTLRSTEAAPVAPVPLHKGRPDPPAKAGILYRIDIPITVHDKIQRYHVNVEARLDEDEDAVEILSDYPPSEGFR